MRRETHRRLALLAIIGSVSGGWVVALESTSVTSLAVASAASAPTPARLAECPFPRELRPSFEAAARDAELPPAMLYAVAKVESNLRENVESAAGARGLLQVMPATARSLDLNENDSSSNVLAGARYLRLLLDRFGSSDLALAAYNAGPTAVAVAGGAPSVEVQRYVANVDLQWQSVAGCR